MRTEPVFSFINRGVRANIGCARVIRGNERVCNGILHYLDRPLMIPERTVLGEMAARPELSEFLTMLELAGLDDKVGEADFRGTVLALTNEAINEAMSADEKQALIEDAEKLGSFLRRHILTEEACCHSLGSTSIFRPRRVRNMDGSRLPTSIIGGEKRIGGVAVMECDVGGKNGLLHILAGPLPPQRRRTTIFSLFNDKDFNNLDWPF
jgi:uncharacterized surface protein with fasciclin (FAS1) repeats